MAFRLPASNRWSSQVYPSSSPVIVGLLRAIHHPAQYRRSHPGYPFSSSISVFTSGRPSSRQVSPVISWHSVFQPSIDGHLRALRLPARYQRSSRGTTSSSPVSTVNLRALRLPVQYRRSSHGTPSSSPVSPAISWHSVFQPSIAGHLRALRLPAQYRRSSQGTPSSSPVSTVISVHSVFQPGIDSHLRALRLPARYRQSSQGTPSSSPVSTVNLSALRLPPPLSWYAMNLNINIDQMYYPMIIVLKNRIAGVMVSMLPSSVIDRGFGPRRSKIKDYNIGICCFSSKHVALKITSKSNDLLA